MTYDSSDKIETFENCPKIIQLRSYMASKTIDAFIVPSDDPHLSEYPSKCFKRREFISGFTGSAGTVVITKTKKLLWTDGRYFLQSEKELDSSWKIMKHGVKDVPKMSDWLIENVGKNKCVGIDPLVHSSKFYEELSEKFKSKEITIFRVPYNESNPVDMIWGKDRPSLPNGPIRIHALKYAGETVQSKLENIRSEMKKKKADAMVLCLLDEIAYMLNIRGSDIEFNPVAISYLIITDESCILFINSEKITNEVNEYLKDAGVTNEPYENVISFIEQMVSDKKSVWTDPSKVNAAVYLAVPKNQRIADTSPISMAKAIKNSSEMAGMKNAHIRDGVALCEFFCWLESEVKSGKKISEVELDQVLTEYRSRKELYHDKSFETISGYGPNGAIIHYTAKEGECGTLGTDSMFLLDSGAQYLDGTTDVTRTVHFGVPSMEEKKAFSLVLKGYIGLESLVFPEGTPGCLIDSFARKDLWKNGMDYNHGTGHGVGAALIVHEGPHGIGKGLGNDNPIKAGMIVSNEPGYYLKGKFGVRIENLLEIYKTDLRNEEMRQDFLAFRPLTLVPLQQDLVDVNLMSHEELDWLDDYHKNVWDSLSLLVNDQTKVWLRDMTLPLSRQRTKMPR
mmetsp:Transcript_2766/g.3846  ORF Transcript_2766/g.3846 Transcript_2766/m.3846 type:complete len:622 (+) Transcript_2766:63-1928(+)